MTDKLDELRRRLSGRSADTTNNTTPTAEEKPKMKANRMDRTTSGIKLEELEEKQLTSLLDRSNVYDRGPIITELDRRSVDEMQATAGYVHETGLDTLRKRYAARKKQETPKHEFEPQVEPPAEPEYTIHLPYQAAPETADIIPPLSLDVIKEIDRGEREYALYLQEIYESAWDYVDYRQSGTPMYSDAEKAKDFVWTHMNEIGRTVDEFIIDPETGKSKQKGLCLVILNAYLYWKKNNTTTLDAKAPPFKHHPLH